ncbi:MAG: tRNA ((37)-N6)-threonylcarbamoyltransferase complex dimerization subunit type 1 TsaB [Verrucomicrobiota bacterium]|jgi:tRNA threonylcarbamoyladenosine biosynthesis protein TsaB
MIMLALEFSSDRRSVALARDGEVLAEAAQQTEARATDALGLIEKVLADAKMSREEIEVIAVGLGPGSYTGIRAAIAVAQGWQLARGVKLLGVSSVDALAAQAQAANIFGRVNVTVDAQRGEFYVGVWELSADRRVEVSPLKIIAAAEVAQRKAAGETFLGADFSPTATAVARLAAGRNDFVAGGELQPIYLRATTFVKSPPVRAT